MRVSRRIAITQPTDESFAFYPQKTDEWLITIYSRFLRRSALNQKANIVISGCHTFWQRGLFADLRDDEVRRVNSGLSQQHVRRCLDTPPKRRPARGSACQSEIRHITSSAPSHRANKIIHSITAQHVTITSEALQRSRNSYLIE